MNHNFQINRYHVVGTTVLLHIYRPFSMCCIGHVMCPFFLVIVNAYIYQRDRTFTKNHGNTRKIDKGNILLIQQKVEILNWHQQ